ncbi:cadherin domain-containing protein [Rhizobium sp. G21]|nr:cadherin domain-containing protein [Rhizobium sp. G21]MBB1249609.1 cadherin domain-containing protein [Rhizobium sp. G21]
MGNLQLQQFDDFGAEVGAETAIGFGGNLSLAVGAHGKLAVSYNDNGMLRVQIMEPNHAPTDISLSNNVIDENVVNAPSIAIGELAAIDDNASDTFTYELVDDADGTFRIEGGKLYWNSYDSDPDHESQSSYEITVKVTDSALTSFVRTFTIDVADVNEPVVGLKGDTSASVEENSAAGTVVATLEGNDPDADETFTFEIVDGDDLPFSLVGNQLKLTASPDYETLSSYVLTIRTTDSANHTVDTAFTVYVDNIDDAAPTIIDLYNDDVQENAPSGSEVGYIFAQDPDTFAGLNYSLIGPNADLFEIREESGGMRLYTRGSFNHETTPTLDVTIRVEDGGGRSLDQTFTVNVDDVNDLPVITSENEFLVREGDDRIVQLAATDEDGDQITWTVNPSEGSFEDFFAFQIDGDGYLTLDPAVEADAPWDTDGDGVYHFRVSAYDGSESVTQEMTVTVVGGNADPVISGGMNTLVKLKENQTTVKTIVATDPDDDDSSVFDRRWPRLRFVRDQDRQRQGPTGVQGSARLRRSVRCRQQQFLQRDHPRRRRQWRRCGSGRGHQRAERQGNHIPGHQGRRCQKWDQRGRRSLGPGQERHPVRQGWRRHPEWRPRQRQTDRRPRRGHLRLRHQNRQKQRRHHWRFFRGGRSVSSRTGCVRKDRQTGRAGESGLRVQRHGRRRG